MQGGIPGNTKKYNIIARNIRKYQGILRKTRKYKKLHGEIGNTREYRKKPENTWNYQYIQGNIMANSTREFQGIPVHTRE